MFTPGTRNIRSNLVLGGALLVAFLTLALAPAPLASAGDGAARTSKVKKFGTKIKRVEANITSMSGRVRPKGNKQGPSGVCFVSRTVKVIRITGNKNVKIASTMSNPNTGDFNIDFQGMGGPGKYQAVAPKFTVKKAKRKIVCKRGTSEIVKVM